MLKTHWAVSDKSGGTVCSTSEACLARTGARRRDRRGRCGMEPGHAFDRPNGVADAPRREQARRIDCGIHRRCQYLHLARAECGLPVQRSRCARRNPSHRAPPLVRFAPVRTELVPTGQDSSHRGSWCARGNVSWRRLVTARYGRIVEADRPEPWQAIIILTKP